TVVVTGGSDGMGRSVAIQLARKGANVIVVARNKQKLAAIHEVLKNTARGSNQRFHTISADLTNEEEANRAIEEAVAFNDGMPPDVVWCCAGNCVPGFFAESSIQTMRSQMDTVYWTAANTAHATLQRWLKPCSTQLPATSLPPRHLIFTASTLAFTPVAGYAPYSPAKAAMRSLADTLNQEVQVYNGARASKQAPAPQADVKIHTIFPMGILTPGYETEEKTKPGLTKKLEEADKPQTPDEVAQITIRALEKGEYLITTMFIGTMMKASAMASSVRNYFAWDTMLSLVSNVAFLGVIWDLNRTAWYWGKKHGIPEATR
ncbi:3-dehydrosphinganine reductase, partial [Ascosphaera atra]